MKKQIVTIVGYNLKNMHHYSMQLNELFDNYIEVRVMTFDEIKSYEAYYADIVLLTSNSLFEEIKSNIDKRCNVVVFSRTISKKDIEKLMGIQTKRQLYVVDETKWMADEMCVGLRQLGIDHLNIKGITKFEAIGYKVDDILLFTNMDDIKNAVRIETFIDINSLLEISVKLHLYSIAQEKRLISGYENLVSSKVGISWMFDRINIIDTRLKVISDSIDYGYLEIDENGEIGTINAKAYQIIEKEFGKPMDLNIKDLFSSSLYEKVFVQKQVMKNELVKAGESDIILTIYPIERAGIFYGLSIIVKDFDEVEKKQHELREKIVGKGHKAKYSFSNIIGSSRAINESISIAKRMAKSDTSILIEGETGTGKELFAQAIHNESYRKDYPFVAVNCGALPENILESELFGYEEGAFTGARKGGKIGLFELAHKGTIFLDEIGEMPIRLQTKLLRVLQEKEIMKLGSDRVINVDIRVIAATNQNLSSLIEKGEFREDLYYRIRVLPLKLLPLRERKEDIVDLFDYYKTHLGGKFELDSSAFNLITSHQWKGNSRELRNIVEYLINNGKHLIGAEDIPIESKKDSETVKAIIEPNESNIQMDESEFVLLVLKEAYDNRIRIGRREIYKKAMEKGLFIGEQKIRQILIQLEAKGLVQINKGRGGTVITKEGILYINGIN